jgi:hypothetical protein
MHKSPLILFLILLIVLVISVLLCKIWSAYCVEGMIGFGSEVNSLGGVKATFYNATSANGNPSDITKLHDSIFFDEKTTRLIHLVGVDSAADAQTRNGVNSMTVYERDSSAKTYPIEYTYNGDQSASFVVNGDYRYSSSAVSPSYSSVVYNIVDSTGNPQLTDYSVFYIPWGLSTYIHMIDVSTNMHVGTYAQLYNQVSKHNEFEFAASNSQPGIVALSVADPPPNTMVDLTDSYWPNRECLKIQATTYLDTFTGNLVVYPTLDGLSSAPTVYNRYNNTAQSAPSDFTSASKYFTDAGVIVATFDPVDNMRVQIINVSDKVQLLYAAVNKDTLVAVIHKTSAGYGLLNTIRLSSDGTYGNTGNGSGSANKPVSETNKPASDTTEKVSEQVSETTDAPKKDTCEPAHSNEGDYLKWLDNYYADITRGSASASSDYILKTQIIPPVCPACQTIGGGSCSNTSDKPAADKPAAEGPTQLASGVVNETGNVVRDVVSDTTGLAKNIVSETTGLAKDTVSGTAGLAKDAVSGTAGFAKDAVTGTAGFAKDAVTGTAGFAKDTVTGTVGLAKDAVTGTVGLAKDILSGAFGLTRGGVSGQGQGMPANDRGMLPATNRGMLPATSVGSDPYSYYGQLPAKAPAAFLPLTADFSSFGR